MRRANCEPRIANSGEQELKQHPSASLPTEIALIPLMLYFHAVKQFVLILLVVLFAAVQVKSQDSTQFMKKKMLVVGSSLSYTEALNIAKKAAKAMQLKLDLRGLKPSKKSGLTFSKSSCEDEFGEYPCYVGRERYSEGEFISIEHASAYPEFKKNYYIVVAAIVDQENEKTKELLKSAKKFTKDAYIKTVNVYIGCIH